MPDGLFRLTTGLEEAARQEPGGFYVGWGIVAGLLILAIFGDWHWRHR